MSDQDRTVEFLSRVGLFKGMGAEQLGMLARGALVRMEKAGTLVVRQGAEGDSMMVVLDGEVEVRLNYPDARELVLGRLGPGAFFGEMSLIDQHPRSANVWTVADTRLASISREAFLACVRSNPEILLRITQELCARLRGADEKMGDFAFYGIPERVARYLIDLAETEGQPEPGGLARVRVRTHGEIAGVLGTSRESVTRAFARLRKGKAIQGRDRCWLVDAGKLARWL